MVSTLQIAIYRLTLVCVLFFGSLGGLFRKDAIGFYVSVVSVSLLAGYSAWHAVRGIKQTAAAMAQQDL
jgi:hypothetical protein